MALKPSKSTEAEAFKMTITQMLNNPNSNLRSEANLSKGSSNAQSYSKMMIRKKKRQDKTNQTQIA